MKRLAASLSVAGRENGYPEAERKTIVRGAVGAYRETLRELRRQDQPRRLVLAPGRRGPDGHDAPAGAEGDAQAQPRRRSTRPSTKDSMQAFKKLTQVVDGEPRIVGDPPLIEPIDQIFQGIRRDQIYEELHKIVRSYRSTLQYDRRVLLEEFRLVDVARKVVGVGSVGTRAWIALLLGRDGRDPLFLQLKEAAALRARGVHPEEHRQEQRRAGRQRPAPDAGRQRHLPRLDCRSTRDRRGEARLLRPPAEGLEGIGRDRADGPAGHAAVRAHVRLDAGPRPRPLAATGSRSAPTWVPATPSTGPSPSSPRPTPTRTNGTTRRSPMPIASGRIEAKTGLLITRSG